MTVQIRRAFGFLGKHGAPAVELKARRPKPRSIAPTPDELRRLKSVAQPWERAWIILQAECGLRISEAFAAAEANHNRDDRTITIVAKGGKPRVIPTTDELEALFAIAPEADASTPLIDRLRGKPIKPQGRWDHWKKFLARAGVREELNPHDLRRSAALRLYEQSRDLRAVQRMLGHDSLTSTLQYLEHYEPENLRPLIEALRIPTEAVQ